MILGILLAIGAASGTAGHGTNRLVVEPAVAQPGAPVTVRGRYLWTDQDVTVSLLAIDGTLWTLGTASTGGNGELETSVVLPGGIPDATYVIVARAANGEDAHVEVVVKSDGITTPVAAGAALVGLIVLAVGALAFRMARSNSRA